MIASVGMPPRKRKRAELGRLSEPHLSQNQEVEFARGVALFNKQQYYEAHEAWENVWRDMSDKQEDDAEIIFRGLIQFTAGLHLFSIGKLEGAMRNLLKAKEKLALYDKPFLGIDLNGLVATIPSSVNAPQEPSGYQILLAVKHEN
ncbi:MAG: DUF309 domain-containing protein [Candidatus Marinimicrobia bacterium]|nr:DUF309 domain-containing protein [Candidatus Neomarinimicrobiota bacterium]